MHMDSDQRNSGKALLIYSNCRDVLFLYSFICSILEVLLYIFGVIFVSLTDVE